MKSKTKNALLKIVTELKQECEEQQEMIESLQGEIQWLRLDRERYRLKAKELEKYGELLTPIAKREEVRKNGVQLYLFERR